jgi:hypothetical protein
MSVAGESHTAGRSSAKLQSGLFIGDPTGIGRQFVVAQSLFHLSYGRESGIPTRLQFPCDQFRRGWMPPERHSMLSE